MGTHTSHADASRDVLDALRRIVQALRESSRRAEQHLGISGAQLFVLENLVDGPSQSLNDLAARTFTHQSSVSTVVTRLVEQGFVSRQKSGRDGRQMELALTARGRRLAMQTTGAAQEQLIRSIRGMPPAPRRQLARLLKEVVAGMDASAGTPQMFFHDGHKRPQVHARHRRTPNTNV